jgi:dipeptidyl-peptidase-4
MSVLAMTLVIAAAPVSSDFLREYAQTRRYLAGRPNSAVFTPDGQTVLFLRAQATDPGQLLYAFDVATGKTSELLTPSALLKGAAEKLSVAEKARLERMRVSARGFTAFSLSKDGARILVALSGRLYVVEMKTQKVTELKTGEGAALDPKFSPDGKYVGYARNNDVYVVELAKNREQAVTRGGTTVKPNGLAEFVAQEEMSRFSGFWFSPDSKEVLYQSSDHSGMEQFAIDDPMHPEEQAQAFYYPRPGKQNVRVSLSIKPLAGGKARLVKWNDEKFPYLATAVWPVKGALSILVQNREQTVQELLSVDVATGKTKRLLEEHDEAWLNLDQDFPSWRSDGSAFFWMTERNGAPEVELRSADGSFKETWVKKEAGFAKWVGFDEGTGTAYFLGSPNPTQTEVWRQTLGVVPTRFQSGDADPGTQLAELADDGKALVVVKTSRKQMPKSTVLKSDGTVAGELPSVAVEPKLKLSMEIRRVGAEPGFWAGIVRPTGGVKSGVKLPVVLNVYGGPGHREVMESMRENLLLQWVADQGYIVVKFDGRGTPRRGRDWERAIKNDFATLTVEDQVTALKALAKEVPEMDLARVGVYGWSFGGTMASLLAFKRPDIVKAAVAGAPVTDWLDYDTHYTERFLGLPQANPKAYEVSSPMSYVKDSKSAHLLLIHGTGDDNVYFSHSLKLSDALFRAGKPHQVLPLSNFTHMVPEPVVLERLWERIAGFFKENL